MNSNVSIHCQIRTPEVYFRQVSPEEVQFKKKKKIIRSLSFMRQLEDIRTHLPIHVKIFGKVVIRPGTY